MRTRPGLPTFFFEIERSGLNGVILIGAPAENSIMRDLGERVVLASILAQGFDAKRVAIRFMENGEFWQEYWTTPAGSFDVPVKQFPRDFKLCCVRKPIMLDQDRVGDDILEIPFDQSYLANFLKANPELSGRVLVFENSRRKFRRTMFRLLNLLTKTHGANRARLRFIHRNYSRGDYGSSRPGTELWLDPPKK